MSRESLRRALQPTWLDRAIGTVAPRMALRRIQYRAAAAALSGYHGARRDRKPTLSWSTAAASADADTLPALDVLRARSRDLVRNDPLAQSVIATKAVNVIGSGHQVRPEIDAARVGLSQEAAEAWEALALDVWQDWAGSDACDAARALDFGGLEDLVYRSQLMSGDVLVLRRFIERPGRLLATALQVVEADRLSNPHWASDTATLAGGIERDADGAPVAYHVANRHILDRGRQGKVEWTRIPARDAEGRWLVLHVHGVRWRPDMSRYAPVLAPVIESLKQRSRYTEAELMAAVVSACFAVGMKSPEGDLGAGLAVAQAATASAADSWGTRQVQEATPGTVFDLAEGEDIQSFEPGRPNPQFAPFIDAAAQEVGAGTDLPYELLLKKFQSSYSASRAAMEMAWQGFRAERARHVAQFCRPVYEAVIGEAVARGVLAAPGFFADPLRRRAWLGATWMGPARPSIDPVKDANADRTYLEMGATSLTRIVGVRFGQDAREVRRRRAMDGSEEAAGRLAAPAALAENDANDEAGA